MRFLNETNSKILSLGVLFLRCMIGFLLFATGASKVFGWFGGFGIEKTLGFYAVMGFSTPLGYLSMFTELIGGFLLIAGLFTRVAAIPVMINMIVATSVMIPKGFLIGFSLPLMVLVNVVVIFLTGPMAYSIDSFFLRPGQPIHELEAQTEKTSQQKNNQNQKVLS